MNQTTFAPMMTPRYMLAAAAFRGKLYAVGGFKDGMDSIEFCDINEGQWTQALARMSQRRHGCAAAAIGNSIYVAGGDDYRRTFDSAEAFDVDRGSWRPLCSMSTKRVGCAGVAVGDEFIVIGGKDESGKYLSTAEVFNVGTGRWEDLPPMKNRRYRCAATVIKNKIYVVGGRDGRLRLDTVESFDLNTRRWTLLPSLRTRRVGCAAAGMSKYLVVTGGCNGYSRDGTPKMNAVEIYDVDAETWSEHPSISTKRSGCAAVSLGGFVYVMGGRDRNRSDLDSVEEIQFSDDMVKGVLVDWSEGLWRGEVAPLLHRQTSVVHKMGVDVPLMPTLLSNVAKEQRVQTVFSIIRGEMSIFKYTSKKEQAEYDTK